jgi:RNA polymerase sigma factor (sigma-70 family)
MPFVPQQLRLTQLSATEELLSSIEPDKAYPLDFVIYRITGYRPKSSGEDLLTGLALQHDLGLLIEQVSESLELRTDVAKQPVLDIDQVCGRFNVTSKTIQRWRRKGLSARRFIFPDGRRRVGFLLAGVERFFAAHHDQLAVGANFLPMEEPERLDILRHARRLAGAGASLDDIARRIGRRFNRSSAMVLQAIRRHDEENPASPISASAAPEFTEIQRLRIVRGHRRGKSLLTLSRRMGRPRSAIYRIVLEERLNRLIRRRVKFIDDPLYHQDDAADAVAAIVRTSDGTLADDRRRDERVPRDLPRYLADLYRTPLLSPSRERALFHAFNFHKFQFVTARRQLDPQQARGHDLRGLENLLADATEVKNQIVAANLRLVVSVARQHLRDGLSLMELVSEGNLTLMRAVEGFDAHRGYRFSTYATLALMKGLARSVPQLLAARCAGAQDGLLACVADPRNVVASHRFDDREQITHLLACLDDRERRVLLAHYGFDARTGPATFDQLGRTLGLSGQRVRQIERIAISKIRQAAAQQAN